ncbi:MAG: SDR family oxidoreductase [Propionibacteriaceae bacterium]|nr:SDR family oxidoreductase [Propionibacteriaceae bacterium]
MRDTLPVGTGLRVLVLGGSGIISNGVVRHAAAIGHEVTVLNRGRNLENGRPSAPPEVHQLRADIRDRREVAEVLGRQDFDVVLTFLGFTPEQVQQDVDLFAGRTGQYIFISSASAYQTPPTRLPVTESTPLRNPYWQYSREKIACEDLLTAVYRDTGFPMTIVRPSHTYDPTMVPFDGGWTVVDRMLKGRPVIVPGDGTSLWTITHHTDFARALVGLFGHPQTLGEAVHITSDEAPTWNELYRTIGRAAGVEPVLLHLASDRIAAMDAELGAALLGDKANSMVFDNSKIRALVPGWRAQVPFARGAREIIAWHRSDPARQKIDSRMNDLFDQLAARHSPH